MLRPSSRLGILTALLVAACSSSSTTDAGKGAASANADGGGRAEPIRIGLMAPLTGSLYTYGQPVQNGARAAQEQINALGGVLGRPVKIEVSDDTGNVDVAKGIVSKWVAEKFVMGLGPSASGIGSAIQPLIHDAKFPMVANAPGAPSISTAEPPRDRYFFRMITSHLWQARTLAYFLSKGPVTFGAGAEPPCTKLAIVFETSSYGSELAKELEATFKKLGGAVVESRGVPTQVKQSYEEEAKAMVAAKPQCQVMVLYPDAGLTYYRDWLRLSAASPDIDKTKFITVATNSLHQDAFITKGRTDPSNPNADSIVAGVYVSDGDNVPDTPAYAEYRNIYKQQFSNEEPPPVSSWSYDAAVLAALAIQAARTTEDRTKIRDALFAVSKDGQAFTPSKVGDAIVALAKDPPQDVDFAGASGPVDFDDNGDVYSGYVIYKADSRKFNIFTRLSPETYRGL